MDFFGLSKLGRISFKFCKEIEINLRFGNFTYQSEIIAVITRDSSGGWDSGGEVHWFQGAYPNKNFLKSGFSIFL